jgi:hypothetical protein
MPTELVHLVNPAVVSEAIERAAAEAKALELLDSGLWCDVRVLPAEGKQVVRARDLQGQQQHAHDLGHAHAAVGKRAHSARDDRHFDTRLLSRGIEYPILSA